MIQSDEELIKAFNEYMAANPYTTRNKVQRALNTSIQRLEMLGCKLPLKLHPSAAALMAKKTGGWGTNFRLKGSPLNKPQRSE